MNKKLLRAKMTMNGDTNEKLAAYLWVHPTTLSMKINEYRDREFTQGEIRMIRERYSLTDTEVVRIFFT